MNYSLDSIRLAEAIDNEAKRRGVTVSALIEINSAREISKGGIMPEDLGEFLESLKSLEGVRVRGLMTMAPRCEIRQDYFKYFLEYFFV